MADTGPLAEGFARKHPDELAALLVAGSREELLETISALSADAAGRVIARLPHVLLTELLAGQGDEVVADWLAGASTDDALCLFVHLAEDRRKAVLARLPRQSMRRTLERLAVYPGQTVGALVDPAVVRVSATMSLAEAVAMLQEADYSELEHVWVVNDQGLYVGMLDLGQALLNKSDHVPAEELAVVVEPLRAETALSVARDVKGWLRHTELPVVDYQQHFLGVLSRERLMTSLASVAPRQQGVMDGVNVLIGEYFRIMGVCLGDLLSRRGSR